jgi:hypothetical protein
MVDYTRRTHIVRVPMDGSDPAAGTTPDTYIDWEVLDAIAFRIENGREVILDMSVSNSKPHIVDNTGGGHGRSPAQPTQRTRMERVKNGASQIDIEVLEAMSFRDQNGKEWILDMQGASDFYDVTDHTGSSLATRRVHDEKVFAGTKPAPGVAPGSDYLTCQRCDNIAFRTTNGKEVIILTPSYDDGNGARASTYVWSPKGYDPNDEHGPQPPTNKDAHVYSAPVSGASGFMTAAAKLKPGPFWWIRKCHFGSDLLAIEIIYQSNVGVEDMPFTAFAFDSDQFDALTLVSAPLAATPSLDNPITQAMLNSFYMFTVEAPADVTFPQTAFIEQPINPVTFVDYLGRSFTEYSNFQFVPGVVSTNTIRRVTLFFNLSKIKTALPPDATSVTISVQNPATPTGSFNGPAQAAFFLLDITSSTGPEAIAGAEAELATIDGFGGVLTIHAFPPTGVHVGGPDTHQVIGTFLKTPSIRKFVNWSATAWSYGPTRDKTEAVAVNERPPISNFVSTSKILNYNAPGDPSLNDDLSFTVDLTTLEITPQPEPPPPPS